MSFIRVSDGSLPFDSDVSLFEKDIDAKGE